MKSKALQVNLECTRVDVTVEERYKILLAVMDRYPGVKQGLNDLLEELCHPYKNWEYIVKEARSYALNYFHVLRTHPQGPEAARLYADIFFQALESAKTEPVKRDAADNLLFFLQHIIRNADDSLPDFSPLLEYGFDRIRQYPEEIFHLFVTSFYQITAMARDYLKILKASGTHLNVTALNALLEEALHYTYSFWLNQEDPLVWFQDLSHEETGGAAINEILRPVSHQQLQEYQERLKSYLNETEKDPVKRLQRLASLPGFGTLVNDYASLPQGLLHSVRDRSIGPQLKLVALLNIMNINGLSAIHEQTLRDINRSLAGVIENEPVQEVQRFLEKIFTTLRSNIEKFPETALHAVLNMGKALYQTDKSELVEFFIDGMVSLGFQAPEIKGVGEDWQIRANAAHLQNIRTWLELIGLKPKWSKKLISSLIINLSLSGVLIRDTDLFPRDITRLLNSDTTPVYNLIKQLTRLLPVFYSDIGAEGELREISTQIDEVCLRKDPLSHFIRKQSHVESSNQIVSLMEATLTFWKTGDKSGLAPYLPEPVLKEVETRGPFIDGVREIMNHIIDQGDIRQISDLAWMEEETVKALIRQVSGASPVDAERAALMISLYKLLYQKYQMSFTRMEDYLSQLRTSGLPDPDRLREALARSGTRDRLRGILGYLEDLKAVILSHETYDVREDIYRKRHFTVDIPSMYGSYHELKFEALGLTFRLESLINTLFEEMVQGIDLRVITKATFSQILDYLRLFERALNLDGISSIDLGRHLDLLANSLEIRGFSHTQYLDIFRGLSKAVGNIVSDYFNNIHQENLLRIIKRLPKENLLPKYRASEDLEDSDSLTHRVTEVFLRDRIAASLSLQQLDLFLGRILHTLFDQSDKLPDERVKLLLSYDPQKAITRMDRVRKGLLDIIHLGSKGFNLVKMQALGLPVPPGFIVTTEVFRCREVIDNYPPAKKNFQDQVAAEVKHINKASGKSFGNPKDPLLFSVRSGSSVSQPGMMNTFLDVGINEAIVHGLIRQTKNEWFGWDTYRRFLQSYGMAFGLIRDDFDAIINEFKQRLGLRYKRYFPGDKMREVAMTYKTLIQDNGIEIAEDPLEQLYVAIGKVFDSWDVPKARTYRRIMGISDDWGTAVTVQSMVFGNFSPSSGAGVFFTHNPRWSGDTLMLWGDFTRGNQGEDVVSGLVKTLPISESQAEIENRDSQNTLETLFPKIYDTLREWAKTLIYEENWSPQEVEFTFEGPTPEELHFLQTREMAIRERRKVYSFGTLPEGAAQLIGHGIGVSGGAMTGRVVFSLEEINQWRKKEPGTALIMVRSDTVPDDIREIYEADGLLTARGGSTSHAAIVAHRLDKTCVVGCPTLICSEKERSCAFDQFTLHSGDWISIDGLEGSVYLGQLKIDELEED
ncbi:MAG: pyruvate, phosphate dikinase [Deltaproteobacteria bacterium]|nr:pyruvate, phosphate dikinase [Deltaproteobacteria bacterium]